MLADAKVERLLHGTTVATNMLLERKGARTVLVSTAGFDDVIEIGRQDRPALYDSMVDRPSPLAPRDLRLGVTGRVDAAGAELEPLGNLDGLLEQVIESRPEAVAVSLLFAYASPAHERAVADALARVLEGVPVSLSSEVAPEFREFERTSTTLLNAYLEPGTGRYLTNLRKRIDRGRPCSGGAGHAFFRWPDGCGGRRPPACCGSAFGTRRRSGGFCRIGPGPGLRPDRLV